MKNIVWLASYPKSGNTWIRIILSYLQSNNNLNINKLHSSHISSSRDILNYYCGYNTSLLHNSEIDLLRYNCNNDFAKSIKELIFIKCHESYRFINNKPILGSQENYKSIYIIRNPLSIVASFANHLNLSIDETIDIINNNDYCLVSKKNKYQTQITQRIYSWSNHVKSWINNNNDINIIKYEELHNDPFKVLKKAFNFSNLVFSDDDLTNAIENASFDKIYKQEKENYFIEKPLGSTSFFRKGKSNSWKEELNYTQINKIININYDIMEKFNYLP